MSIEHAVLGLSRILNFAGLPRVVQRQAMTRGVQWQCMGFCTLGVSVCCQSQYTLFEHCIAHTVTNALRCMSSSALLHTSHLVPPPGLPLLGVMLLIAGATWPFTIRGFRAGRSSRRQRVTHLRAQLAPSQLGVMAASLEAWKGHTATVLC